MNIKINGKILFCAGFLLIMALLIAGLYNYIGITGIVLGASWMLAGILMNYLECYVDIDTTNDVENDEEKDERDIR